MSQRTKTIDQLLAASSKSGMKKSLGALNLTTLGIGAIIGTGIFVLTGTAAANFAGPAIVLSFIFSGIACACAALCYTEFASMIPISGSAYTYAFATMGQFFAWVIGWDLILEYLFASSTVAVGWSGYMVSFLKDYGVIIPPELIASTGTKLIQIPQGLANVAYGWQPVNDGLLVTLNNLHVNIASLPAATAIMNVPAMFIVAITSLLLILGIKESATVNNIIVIMKLAVVVLFITIGFQFVKTGNWHPFIPSNKGESELINYHAYGLTFGEALKDFFKNFGKYGISGIFTGAGVIFFAYIGFDAVSTAAQEAKNPQKDMKVGILGSLIICTVLYILVSLVMTGIVNYTQLGVPAPIANAVDAMGPGYAWLATLAKLGAIAGLTSVILVMLLGQPRIFYSMAKDNLLPPLFAKIHPKFKTPHITTMVTGAVAMAIAATFPIYLLGELVSIGTLLAFVMVCAGILILRKKRPDIPRPFKTPWVPVVPIIGIVMALIQMVSLPPKTWLRLIGWMALGLIIYYWYSKPHAEKMDRMEELEEAALKGKDAPPF